MKRSYFHFLLCERDDDDDGDEKTRLFRPSISDFCFVKNSLTCFNKLREIKIVSLLKWPREVIHELVWWKLTHDNRNSKNLVPNALHFSKNVKVVKLIFKWRLRAWNCQAPWTSLLKRQMIAAHFWIVERLWLIKITKKEI